jgi:hypothetical protein
VKEEASPLCVHIPLSTPHFFHGLILVKKEVPPSFANIPLATSLLPPPPPPAKRNPQDPYCEDGSCMVEEEIPPRWQVEENKMAANENTTEVTSEEKEEEKPQQFANLLMEEHLQLIFEIGQNQDDQMHSQRILGQRMDILFEALADAPARTRCPTCGQRFTPVYNIHGKPVSAME